MPIVQIIIDDSTSKVITGTYEFDRTNGGTLLVPSGSAFPGTPAAKELFWRTDEAKLYRRNDANDAWVVVSGEINTASNVGASGVGVYDSKVGVDLRFRKLNAASAKISVALNSQQIDLDVVPAQIAHQDLSGAGTNAHSAIDTHLGSTSNPHSVTKTQVSLGNVTDDAQLKRAAADFATFTEKVVPVAADLLLLEDSAAAGAKKKVQVGHLPGGGSSIFGGNYQVEVSEETSTTTSSTMQDKVTLTTPALTGTYRVAFFCEITIATANTRHQCRLYNVTDDAELCFDDTRPSIASMYSARGGFQNVTFAGAAKTFKIQFASQNNSATVTIRRARIELWRVS